MSRLIAIAATVATLVLLFAAGPSGADEPAPLQERLTTQPIVLDPSLSPARLASAARRLPRRPVVFETRTGPDRTEITRFPETFAEGR